MTSIIAEINTIGDLLSDVGVTAFYKQDLDKKHKANTIGIRWLGDRDVDATSEFFSVVRTYQVTYFGKSEIDCITNIDKVRCALNKRNKVKVREQDAYMTLGHLGLSQPIKSETDGVYFVIGIITAQIFAKHLQDEQEFELIQKVDVGLNDSRLEITSESVKYTQNGGNN